MILKLSLTQAYNTLPSVISCLAGGSSNCGNFTYSSFFEASDFISLKNTTRFTWLSNFKLFLSILTTFLSFGYFKIDLIRRFVGFSTLPLPLLYLVFFIIDTQDKIFLCFTCLTVFKLIKWFIVIKFLFFILRLYKVLACN